MAEIESLADNEQFREVLAKADNEIVQLLTDVGKRAELEMTIDYKAKLDD